jgi:hypothetical protein
MSAAPDKRAQCLDGGRMLLLARALERHERAGVDEDFSQP